MPKTFINPALCAAVFCASSAMAGAAPAGQAKAVKPAKPASTPVRLDLPCPALQGPVGLDISVKDEQAVLRVEYPRPVSGPADGVLDTRIYFDSDNDVRSGLEEWDADSLKLKGVDYSVEAREEVAKVFKHEGGMASASGSFTSEYRANVATFTVDLFELQATRGSMVKALFLVGECGPVSQTFRLGAPMAASARRARTRRAVAGQAATAAKAPSTPIHLDLPCTALNGSVGLDVDVKGQEAVLRVAYPGPFASYRGRATRLIDTFIYFDSDNDLRTGLEEWDDQSLKIKGADYSVEVLEHPSEGPDAVGGFILNSKVFKHEGTMANATGTFKSEYLDNLATFTVELAELHVVPGGLVKAMFMVGECGPVSQIFRMGGAVAAPKRR